MNRILQRLAAQHFANNTKIDINILKQEVTKILNELYQSYPPNKNAAFWIKQSDTDIKNWLLMQAVLFKLSNSTNKSSESSKNINENDVYNIITNYINTKVLPTLNTQDISPKILPILNSKDDAHLVISFDPANPNERDNAVVVMREYNPNKSYIDHAFIGQRGETHSHIQSNHLDILKHCKDEKGTPTICHANYWKPIIFLTGYNTFNNIKDIVNAIKSKYPNVKKIYTFNGGINGGMIHKVGKIKNRLLIRIA